MFKIFAKEFSSLIYPLVLQQLFALRLSKLIRIMIQMGDDFSHPNLQREMKIRLNGKQRRDDELQTQVILTVQTIKLCWWCVVLLCNSFVMFYARNKYGAEGNKIQTQVSSYDELEAFFCARCLVLISRTHYNKMTLRAGMRNFQRR